LGSGESFLFYSGSALTDTFEFPYELRIVEETIAGVPFRFECLNSLDQTIDMLFEELQRRNIPDALEKLCPYFGVIWPAARGLAEIMAQKGARGELKGAKILEIGCGLALPSLVAAKFGAQVVATDSHPDVPRFLKRNIELNEISQGLRYVSLDWANSDIGVDWDWTIGSDILYERQHAQQVAYIFCKVTKPGGRIILADPGRPYLQQFEQSMLSLGFKSSMDILRVTEELSYKASEGRGKIAPKDVFILDFEKS
jgi:predicted nicotinamide N-methyase